MVTRHGPTRRRALRDLVDEARRAAAQHHPASDAHAFYLGVRAAGDDGLHPRHLDRRAEGWLAMAPPAFRDGYIQATAAVIADRRPGGHYLLPGPRSELAGGPARP